MLKRLSCFILSVCTVLSLGSCGNFETASSSKQEAVSANTAGMLEKIVVNDFEKPSDYSPLRVDGLIRIYKETSEIAYSGDSCAKILMKKTDTVSIAPMMYQPFNLEAKENYSDWSYVTKLGFNVYNAQSQEMALNMKFVFAGGATLFKQYTLKPNQWNEIVYENYREYMPDRVCEGIWFIFSTVSGEDTTYYVDDVTVFKTTKGYNTLAMELDEHEICSFDKVYQTNFTSIFTECRDTTIAPIMSASSFSADGGTSLFVEMPAGDQEWMTSQLWPGLELYSPMLKMIDWSLYDDNDRLCFDIYSPKENGTDHLWFGIYNGSGARVWKKDGVVLPKNRWTTYSYTVAEISESYGRANSFNSITNIRILWGEFTGENRCFYVDNFRMEIVPNE